MRSNANGQQDIAISFSKKMYVKKPKDYEEENNLISDLKKNILNKNLDELVEHNEYKSSENTKKNEKGNSIDFSKNNFFNEVKSDNLTKKQEIDSRFVDLNNIPTDKNCPITPLVNIINEVEKNLS